MPKSSILLSLALLFAVINLSAQSSRDAYIIDDDDIRLEYSRVYSILQGRLPQTGTGLLSNEELRFHLENIPQSDLTSLSSQLLDQAMEAERGPWNYQEGELLDFQSSFELNLFGYFGAGDDEGREWQVGYNDRPGVINVPLEIALFDLWYSKIGIQLNQDYFHILDQRTSNVNLFTDFGQVDMMWPYEALTSLTGEHWNIQLGRDRFQWGPGQKSSLLVSDAPGHHEFLTFNTWWRAFRFSFLWLNTDLYPWRVDTDSSPAQPYSGDETFKTHTAGNHTFFLPEYEGVYDNYNIPSSVQSLSSQEGYKWFLAHRLEFQPTESFEIIFTESILFQDRTFQPRYLNPLMAFHNWYLDGNADINISLDLSWVPFSGLFLYGQVLGDQIAIGINRTDTASQQYPGAMGYMAGVQYILPMGQTSWIDLSSEWAMTDPYTYIDRSGINHYVTQRYVSNVYGGLHILLDRPLGFYLGPDAIMAWFRVKYVDMDAFEVYADYEFQIKGEHTIHTPWSKAPGEALKSTPSGANPISNHIVGLGGEYRLDHLGVPFFDRIYLTNHLIWTKNFQHIAGDNRLDYQLSLGLRGKY